MKLKSFILLGLIPTFIFTALFISCSSEEQNNISSETLKKYANIHNSGLDYIKSDVQRTQNICTPKYLNEVLEKYTSSIYSKEDVHKIMQEIALDKKLIFNGHIPSLAQTRSSISTNIALEACNECMDKIKNHLNAFKDDEIFDNKYLLEDLHVIINKVYDLYIQKCNSDIEKQTLAQSLGVFYGSIGYWSNSENVESWSKIEIEKTTEYSSNNIRKIKDGKQKKKNQEKKKELSKKEYLEAMAAADVAGAYLGAAIASGPLAVAASAAAALYFDVK